MLYDNEDALLNEDNFTGSIDSNIIDLDEIEDSYDNESVDDNSITDKEWEKLLGKNQTPKNYYCPPDELLQEYRMSIMNDEPTPKLINFLFLIAKNTTFMVKNIRCDLDKNSCINYAVSTMWADKWHTYDENRSEHIFAYYTKVLVNDMKSHILEINKKQNVHIQVETLFLE